jgi:putative ABC transport system permease protein
VKFSETLKLALSAVWAHKLRSALTLLGMIIGVTAVVAVVSLIQGFNKYVDEKIANVGAKAYRISRFNFEDFRDQDTIAAALRRNRELTLDDYDYLRSRLTLTERLGAKARGTRLQVKRGSEELQDVMVDGATANIADIERIDIAEGRYFTEAENDAAARVAYIGADVASRLFPAGNAMGGEITIQGIPYRIIGIGAAKGTIFGMPQDVFVQLPLKTYGRNFGGLINQRSLYFVGTSVTDELFNDAVEEARAAMRARRRLSFGEKDNFGVFTPDAVTGMRDRIFGPIFIVAIAVPGIALLVGGIVIMNIMLVSVTERTKEIGIRKSLGARRTDILKQFLVEAITLAAIGGAIGVVLAWIVGRILSGIFIPTQLSIVAVIVAVGVSGTIGVLAGIFPAWKAARLDPIEALRAD